MVGVPSFVFLVVSLFPYVVLVAVWALNVIYHPTLGRFFCFLSFVDSFVVHSLHWYVIALENPCQLTNVGRE